MSKAKTKISVIIPVHDHPNYLTQCLTSVINQTLKEIQIICIDDNSNIEIKNTLRSFAKQDKRIKVITSKQRIGPWNTRNLGLKKATGEYIAFVDSDDFIGIELLEMLYKRASEEKLDILSHNFMYYTKNGVKDSYFRPEKIPANVTTGKEFFNKIVKFGNYAPAVWARIIKLSFLKKNKIRFEGYAMSEDNVISTRILLKAKRVAYINQKEYYYRVHSGSITHTKITAERLITITRVLKGLYSTANNSNLDSCYLYLYNHFVYLTKNILVKANSTDLKKFFKDTRFIVFSKNVNKQKRDTKFENRIIFGLLKIAYNHPHFFLFIRIYMIFRGIIPFLFRRINPILKKTQPTQIKPPTTNH